jgi:hypothetical protein
VTPNHQAGSPRRITRLHIDTCRQNRHIWGMKPTARGLLILTLAILLVLPFSAGGCAESITEDETVDGNSTVTENITPTKTPGKADGNDVTENVTPTKTPEVDDGRGATENVTPTKTPKVDGGSISGHVYEADGVTPIAGARVSAILTNLAPQADARAFQIPGAMMGTLAIRQAFTKHSPTSPLFWPITRSVTTAADGSYAYQGRFAGEYILLVQADGYLTEFYDGNYPKFRTLFEEADWPKDSSFPFYEENGFVPFLLEREATTVTVTTNQDTPGVDFTLDRPASINGFIYRSNGELYKSNDEYVQITAADRNNNYYNLTTSVKPDGSYTATGLHAAEYGVQAHLRVKVQDKYREITTDEQFVTLDNGEQVQNVNFTLPYYGSISGMLFRGDYMHPASETEITAEHHSGRIYSAKSDADGYYSVFGLPPGYYQLSYSVLRAVGGGSLTGPTSAGLTSQTYYYAGNYTVTTIAGNATLVRVNMDQDTPLIDILVTR